MTLVVEQSDRFRCRQALEALRKGVPNSAAVEILGCNRPEVEDRFDDLLLHAIGAESPPEGALGMLVSGDFGSGKSHLLSYLEHRALKEGFVCSRVAVSKETPLHNLGRVYTSAIQHAQLPGRTGQLMEEMADKINAQTPDYDRFSRWLNVDDNGLHPYFPATMMIYERCNDLELRSEIESFWAGDSISVARVREGLRIINQQGSFNFRAARAADLPAQRLGFATELIKACGYKGWVVFVDELELVSSYSLLQRARSYAELARWLGKTTDEQYPGLIVVGTVTPGFESRVLGPFGKNDRDVAGNRLRERNEPTQAARMLAGNRPDYGEGLYSGQSRLAEQGNAGEAFGPKGPVGSGPVVSGLRGQGHLLSAYGRLASLRGQLFSDDDFAEIYCPDNGRDSVPPSLLATALLLQTYDKVSDAEAKARADFDIRWKVALGIEIEDRPFAKSTLQMFRAQLILHEKVREVFESSLRLARQSGYLKKRGMRVALDTTYILGRGAVKDTYNLLADGIVKLLRALAAVANIAVGEWAEAQGYERYFGSSIKGEATIDWSDRKARAALLGEIVADADRLLELARQAWVELPEASAQRQSIVAGAELLLQDVERKSGDGDVDAHADAADDGVSIRDGVSKDRMLSVHDPELRHGHKSSRRRFDGHKAAIVVDTDSQLITAVDVLPGNAPDNLGALELVEASEASTGSVVEEAMGDAAYGDGGTRQTFAEAGRRLVAKVPGRPDRKHFPKNDFHLDLAAGSCTCPAGQVTRTIVPAGKRTDRTGRVYRLQAFQFDGAVCGVCPLPSQCIAAQGSKGRRVLIHPQEGMLQQARALQQSADYDEYRARRVVVEHRLARLVQLGIRQARYFGRVKTKFQLYLAATVANLTLVAGKIGRSGSTGGGAAGHRVVRNDVLAVVANAAANFSAVRLGQLWSLILFISALLPQLHFQIRAFRPGF